MATTRKDLRGRTLRKGEMQRSSDKRYAYSYKDPLGRRKYIYANDLVTLREKETQLTKDQLDGLDIYVAGKATVNFVFDRYMSLKTNLRQTTRSNYLYMYDRFVRDTFGKKKIAVIRYSDVLQFYNYLLDKQDYKFDFRVNGGYYKNRMTKMPIDETTGNEKPIEISTYYGWAKGHSLYDFYLREYAGVDPATGKELYYINGEDGSRETTTNSAQANKTIIGSVEPTVQGGLTNFVSWKFINFNMTLTYSLGGHAYDYATWLQSNGGTYNYLGNVPAYYKIEDTWKKPGDNAKLPQFAYGNTNIASSRWLMSTDHLRIKNITLGFTMPSKVSQKWGINKLRAFVSANNLLTWKSDGLYVDPETPVDGLCTFETPALRTITFGLEVGF